MSLGAGPDTPPLGTADPPPLAGQVPVVCTPPLPQALPTSVRCYLDAYIPGPRHGGQPFPPSSAWGYAAVDNLSATQRFGGEGRTSSAWIQSLRRSLAPLLHHVSEIYVPSQHVTGGNGLLPSLQARCDELAAAAHARAFLLSYPFPEYLPEEALLFLDGALVVDVGLALDTVYRSHVAPSPRPRPGRCTAGWAAVLRHPGCGPRLVRWTLLLRSATDTPDLSPYRAACPLCRFLVPNWGWYILFDCILTGRPRDRGRSRPWTHPH